MKRQDARWIDITVPLKNGMVFWPNNPSFHLDRVRDMSKGNSSNVSVITMGSHTGTHVDAPSHSLPDAKGVDGVDLASLIGVARVIEIKDSESIKPEELKRNGICSGERILFKTKNSGRVWKQDSFTEDFVYLTAEGAQFLAAAGIVTMGLDYLSIGGYKKNGRETHRILFEAGISVIEGLDLSSVNPGPYEFICLPLKISGADGAPARAILRPLEA